jgi:hypothetical protein
MREGESAKHSRENNEKALNINKEMEKIIEVMSTQNSFWLV